MIEYDGDVTFTSQENTSRVATAFDVANNPAGGVVDGYYGALEWMFPVSNGSAWANANGAGLYVKNSGDVGIGTVAPTHKLTVKGAIRANEVIVDTGWADDVFEADYKLINIDALARYINENKRLPGVPSTKDVSEKGVSIGETQAILLRKIEEMSLYIIKQDKRMQELEQEVSALRATIQYTRRAAILAIDGLEARPPSSAL